MKIPIDFVAGSHGHYLETVCNQEFGIVKKEDNFTSSGTSHVKSAMYKANKVFDANHWVELYPSELSKYPMIVSIQFSKDDLLLLSSVSLLRAGDANIDNNLLEEDTVNKLLNSYYQKLLAEIKQAYPFLDLSTGSIPRNVLREFFKFGFKRPEINGYWLAQQQMIYHTDQKVLKFNFSSFYNIELFANELLCLAKDVGFDFTPNEDFYQRHQKFLELNPFVNHKAQCDRIIDSITKQAYIHIPSLSLFQESYINGCLENIYNKEMPFHQDKYFTSTRDVLCYLDQLAPNL
jgi:hypothetical protein